MKASSGSSSLWLPGFGDDPAPNLFADEIAVPAIVQPAVASTHIAAADAPATTSISHTHPAWLPSTVTHPNAQAFAWPAWADSVFDDIGGHVTKFDANIAAIRCLHDLTAEKRQPTVSERHVLLRFTGWGGLPKCFNHEGTDQAWVDRAKQLQELLSPSDYKSALASVNTSYYTEPFLIRWIWDCIRKMGFQGGSVVDPSAGTGNFLGCMPADLAARSRISAIELDTVPGQILRALYEPYGVSVRVAAFEAVNIPEESVDLMVSNVPFGEYGVNDKRNRPYSRASIHNWYVGRALDCVRPGGLVCFITSTSFLDDWDPVNRAFADSVADLVTAFRLPQGTFSRLANTSTQADLVVLRKRVARQASRIAWLGRSLVGPSLIHPKCYSKDMAINEYFVRAPQQVLGRIDMRSNGFTAVPTAVLDSESLPEALERSLSLVPALINAASTGDPIAADSCPHDAEAPEGARPGAFLVEADSIFVVEFGALKDVTSTMSQTSQKRVRGMVEIRDKTRRLLEAQLTSATDGELAALRRSLNVAYDRFTSSHGWLSNRANTLAFRRDPDFPLLLSLEHFDEDEDVATKADIFTKRTVAPVSEPASAATPADALALSIAWRGCVDPDYMARLLRADRDAVLNQLLQDGLIFLNPEHNRHESADEYLSGDVKRKLHIAIDAGRAFTHNVKALEAVIPEDLKPSEITVRLGAVWIPAQVIGQFMSEVLKLENVKVAYSSTAGTWSLDFNRYTASSSFLCINEYGTARMPAPELVNHALNVQSPTVMDPKVDGSGYITNKQETLAARAKLEILRDAFQKWAFEDVKRREELCRIYNDTFNCLRERVFDGSHLVLPGFSRCFELHPSQRNAIWRGIQTGNLGLFHCVGAGKTAIMAAISRELRRLGLSNKPGHIVPNHCLYQYAAELVRLYPSASVLIATKEDLVGDRRREFVSRVATGDWDAVVMTHSTFEKLGMSNDYSKSFMEDNIRDLEDSVRASRAGQVSNRIVKQLELMKKKWKLRLQRLIEGGSKDDFLTWEALGIDYVFYDEAHLAKNLMRHTKMTRIAGLPMTDSFRAFDLFIKTRYTMSLHRGQQRGVVLATATPVANTMAEVHTFQRYLQPRTLRALGLEQFDAWAATFGEEVTALELAPDGQGYRMHTRFARFVNVPDLMAIFREVADVRTREMLTLKVPAVSGGKPRVVSCPASPQLKAFIDTLVKRAASLKNGVNPKVDNMLKITNEGRNAALDMRTLLPFATPDDKSKVFECAYNVHQIWNKTSDRKGTQLVFCDLSTPKPGLDRFSIYHSLRDLLLKKGVPAAEIAFIHDADTDAKKAKLFKKVRDGSVRVLVGSTQKMGVGTNVQQKIAAQHDLDAPWRPCDVEQREGRSIRQGNEFEEVALIRYVTAGSFDAYMWQTLETKAKFIAQVMSGDKAIRSIEDVELATLTYAEVKALASGNPMVIEKAGVDAEIAKLSALFSVWRDQRYRNESKLSFLPMQIDSARAALEAVTADVKLASTFDEESPSVVIRGRTHTNAESIGAALRQVCIEARSRLSLSKVDELVGTIGGLRLCIYSGSVLEETHFYVQGSSVYRCKPYQTGPALWASLAGALSALPARLTDQEKNLADLQQSELSLTHELTRPWEHEDRFTALLVRQREIEQQLDLDKNEAGTEGLDGEAEVIAA